MSWIRKLSLVAALSVYGFLVSQSALATEDDRFDIVGLRLGMGYNDAMKALKAHGFQESSIEETRMSYFYSDGLKHDYRTEEFVFLMSGVILEIVDGKRREDAFNLFFSPPPEGGELVGVYRSLTNEVDPITNEQFREAVIAKYGEPAVNDAGVVNWKFGRGGMNCVSRTNKGIGLPLLSGNTGKRESILDLVFRKAGSQYRLDQFKTNRVTSLEDCASMLEYSIGGMGARPAIRINAQMIDVRSWVKAELAAGEYVEALRQKVTKAREAQSSKPRL